MDNFDLKKYLAEGKLLKENQLFARAPNYMTPNRPLILSANLALFRLGLPPLIHYI
jgi:hypothetical protein